MTYLVQTQNTLVFADSEGSSTRYFKFNKDITKKYIVILYNIMVYRSIPIITIGNLRKEQVLREAEIYK